VRPPATDLRGGNTSEDSFTRLMANLAAVYVVDFPSGLFLDAALFSTRSEGSGCPLCPILKTDRNRSEKEG